MARVRVEPVTSALGAEIQGVDLRKGLAPEVVREIEAALLEYQVLFFRGQDIDPEQQKEFARYFGTISVPPFAPKHGTDPEYIVLDQVSPRGQGADQWHSDNTFIACPPMGSILKAVKLPEVGGDTCFASSLAAYEALSAPLRSLCDGLRAVHDLTRPLEKAIEHGQSIEDLKQLQERFPPVEHPVVRSHPVTGRRGLFVNRNSTTRLLGVSERENELLLPFLCDHIRSPAFQCRFRWDTDSIAFWDNRAVQHFAVADYDERRVMHRVTLEGDEPH